MFTLQYPDMTDIVTLTGAHGHVLCTLSFSFSVNSSLLNYYSFEVMYRLHHGSETIGRRRQKDLSHQHIAPTSLVGLSHSFSNCKAMSTVKEVLLGSLG